MSMHELVIVASASGYIDGMQEAIFTTAAPRPAGFYSQAVRAGNFLFLAGVLPVDAERKLVGGTVQEQTTHVLRNISSILEAAGGTLASLVSVTVYVHGIEHWPAVNEAYMAMMKDVPVPPARAVVPVAELHYGAKVEIQAVALLKEAAKSA
jgi:2-iminobutanoate/2-iminopropanoate deaminase